MSRSPTEHDEEDWRRLALALTRLGGGVALDIGALSRSEVEEFTVYGEGVPASIAYLHSIVARGLGDAYNYAESAFEVEIRKEDRFREASLKNVQTVTLHYRGEGCGDDANL